MMPSRRALLRMDFETPAPAAGHWIRLQRTAMACRFTILLSGEDARHVPAARDELDEVERIEAALTVFRETSDLVRLNRTAAVAPVAVDPETFALLALCRDLHAETGGAFDITSTPLSRCWGFLAREGRLPASEEIEAARARVGMDGVTLDASRRTVHFQRPGLELNLGSIGKGYALRRIGQRLLGAGVAHALLSAGGSSVCAIGGRDGGWPIDICSRQVPGRPLARLRLRNGALGTSGAGEQFVESGGARYGHVIDPRTGRPAEGVLSASVVHRDAAMADALATAFCVGGAALARRYCAAHPNTLALLTPADAPARTEVIGAYPGAALEAAAA